MTWKKLNLNVKAISIWLQNNKIKKGDRVAAYLPNIPEAVVAYIASSAIGAVWSSCSPDFGAPGVIERFSQIKPKILFIGNETKPCKDEKIEAFDGKKKIHCFNMDPQVVMMGEIE